MHDDPAADRLAELRRQRALIQEHLAFLDREIASAEGKPASAPTSTPLGVTAPSPAAQSQPGATKIPDPVTSPTAAEGADDEAEAMLAEYRRPTGDVQRDVRTGCFLYFAAALLMLGLVVTILYFALHRTR